MKIKVLLLCLLATALEASPPKLHYKSNTPVTQTSSIHYTVERLTSLTQELEASLLLAEAGKEPATATLPALLTFTPLTYNAQLGNGFSLVPKADENSSLLGHQAYRLNKPLNLRVESDFSLEKEKEVLQSLKFYGLLKNWFFLLFSLADEELAVGNSYQKKPVRSAAESFTITIEEVNDELVKARIAGTLPLRPIPLEGGRMAMMSGTVEGTASWKRSNALLFDYKGSYRWHSEQGEEELLAEQRISSREEAL